VYKLCSPNVGVVVDFQELFQFDMLILSEDICDQSRKLSKIAKDFGRFFGRHNFFGAGIVKIVPILSLLLCATLTEKSPVRILPLARELLRLTR